MKVRKIISIGLIAALIIGAMSGCSKGKGKEAADTANDNIAKGRYVEEDIKFPEGIDSGKFVSLVKNPEGKVELFTFNAAGTYNRYILDNGVWTEGNKIDSTEFKNFLVNSFYYGEDGKLYVSVYDIAPTNNVIFKQSDNGKFDKISLADSGNLIAYSNALENGMLAAVYVDGEIAVYSNDGQTIIKKLNGSTLRLMTSAGNTIYYLGQSKDEILSYDAETDQSGTSRPIDNVVRNSFLNINNGVMYLCDAKGVHQIKEGNTIWETIIDGERNSLSKPLFILSDFISTDADDYYTVMQDTNSAGKYIIKHYIFDEDIPSVPTTELTIFALKDNRTIRQAISLFQEAHPEVYVTFRIADTGNGAITSSDQIRSLNTELLAKKGADILVLNGLPVDTYIENGVLSDISDIFKDVELLNNITDNYVKKGKIYAMPARFTVPIIYGRKEAVNSAVALKDIAGYIKDNPDPPLILPSNYKALAEWYLPLYYNEITDDKGWIDESLFKEALLNLNEIAVGIGASADKEIDHMNDNLGTTYGYWVSGSVEIDRGNTQANIEDIGSYYKLAYCLKSLEKWKGTYETINNIFKPETIVGINSAGKQKDLAEDFIKLLFSEDIQKTDTQDGLPVNKKAMEDLINKDNLNSFSVGTENYIMRYSYPFKPARQQFFDKFSLLTTPVINDTSIITILVDEADRYLQGEITAEEAAQNAVKSIKVYQSE